jgi:hypothetical protein
VLLVSSTVYRKNKDAANKNELHYALLIFQEGLKIGNTSPRQKAGPALRTASMARFFTNARGWDGAHWIEKSWGFDI